MSARLGYELNFLGGVYFLDHLSVNSYTVSLELETLTTDAEQINIALSRMNHFVYYELGDTVFINQDQNDHTNVLTNIGVNVTELPYDPVDQIIGIMLYCKLNAIMEDRVRVTKVSISSILGGDIKYLFEDGYSTWPFNIDGWWHHSSTQHNYVDVSNLPENVIKVSEDSWAEHDLSWPTDNIDSTNDAAQIISLNSFIKK
jgi:hypothetical protein